MIYYTTTCLLQIAEKSNYLKEVETAKNPYFERKIGFENKRAMYFKCFN